MSRAVASGRVAALGRSAASGRVEAGHLGLTALIAGAQAFWPLTEVSGSRVDVGPNGISLTDGGGVGQLVGVGQSPGQVYPTVAHFTRTSASVGQALNAPTGTALSVANTDFTVAGFVYLDSKPSGSMGWFCKDVNGGTREYAFTWQTDGTLTFTLFGPASARVDLPSTVHPGIGKWYCVIAWLDRTAGTVYIQLNDGGIDSLAYTGGFNSANTAATIGAQGNFGRFWDGRIGPVGLWRRVLTATERTLFARAVPSRVAV